MHGFPDFDGVVPKHAPDDRLTTTAQRSGFDDDPLSVCRGRVIREAANLPLLGIHKPADTFLRCMAINKWPVLVRHDATLAKSAARHGS